MKCKTPEPALNGWLPIGYVQGVHGIRGKLKIRIVQTDFSPEAGQFSHFLLRLIQPARQQQLSIAHLQWTPKGILAHFTDIDSCEAAQPWRGATVACAIEELAERHILRRIAQVIGAEVVDVAGVRLGMVEQVVSNGKQRLLQLDGERLLPWVPQLVGDFNPSTHQLTATVPEGLWY